MKALERPKKPTSITHPIPVSKRMTINELQDKLESLEIERLQVVSKKMVFLLSEGYQIKELDGKGYFVHPKYLSYWVLYGTNCTYPTWALLTFE
jgi:hypothetical protein